MNRPAHKLDPAILEARVYTAIRDITDELGIAIGTESLLAGEGGLLDTRDLVELCLALEDVARDVGFDFGWSTAAFTQPNSMFRTPAALAAGFVRQARGRRG
ncbi:hypothetical protein [Aquabacterium sp.]|uniref:hypothetical protein n=1 Tax=Aquabacterium sp. TaxID=1872578 RepID=UPI0037836239